MHRLARLGTSKRLPLIEASGWNQAARASQRIAKHRAGGERLSARVDRRRSLHCFLPEGFQSPGRGLDKRLAQRQLDNGQDLLTRSDVEARLNAPLVPVDEAE